jgi:exosome complex component CSL4
MSKQANESGSTSQKSQHRHVLPGDSLAAEEEFEAGTGSVIYGGNVVAARVGEVSPDLSARTMTVKPAKKGLAKLPETGDYVIGTVQSAASSVAQILIEAINDIPSSKELSGMLSLRDDRRRRSAPPIKAGDVIRAKVISTTNAIYHLSLDDPKCGVLYTVCSFCGGRVVALGHGAVKCTECGMADDRMLSEDFIEYSRTAK